MTVSLVKDDAGLFLDGLWKAHNRLLMVQFSPSTAAGAAIADGSTNGTFQAVTASTAFRIAGAEYTKAATDDLWDLSGETAVAADRERAYWLYLDSAGAASFAANGDAPVGYGLADLPVPDPTKSVIGVFLAGPETDFTLALTAQGTVTDGIPDGARNMPALEFVETHY